MWPAVRDLSACSAQGVCAYIASSSFECCSRTQQKNGDGRFSTLGDAVDTSGIVIFIVVRTYFVIPAEGQRGQGDIAPVDFPIIFHAARTHFREDSVKNSDVFSG